LVKRLILLFYVEIKPGTWEIDNAGKSITKLKRREY
jgi:hypothetical protein